MIEDNEMDLCDNDRLSQTCWYRTISGTVCEDMIYDYSTIKTCLCVLIAKMKNLIKA